ncbi:MAG: T9SS type A sorting domain-containing protein [Ignavibacteriaceae bacterium]|nr:T9SS type A sorting domain-containing protein [Ignavibacteriaceae bacterium]
MKIFLKFTFSFFLLVTLVYGKSSWEMSYASSSPAPKSISVITPDGGEIFQAGRLTEIQWTSDAVANVKIQFTTNNGASWDTVINKTAASSGSFVWEIPNTISTNQAKIRVIDFTDISVADTSNTSFQIVRLILTSPTLNQKIQTGGAKTIQWTASSNIATVKLEYSTNSGGAWTTIVSNLPATPASYSWTPIPNTPSATANVRISLSSVPEISDTSDNFLITSLELTKPNGGENWFANSFKTITWTSTNLDLINLEYSTNNGSTWNFINSNPLSAGSGSYSWRVASSATAQAKVRISDATVSSINDVSDNVFTISSLKITSPNGGEGFAPTSTQNISWTSNSINTINIEYSTDDGNTWDAIQNSVNANLGSVSWNLPGFSFSDGRIRIVSTDDSTNYDISDNSFKVGSLSVISPNGSEILQKGLSQRIEWTNSSNVANVTIEVSSNNGTTWIPIAFNTAANTGFYNWTVGNFPSNQVLIRISDADNLNILDQSDAVFIIKKLDLVSPLGGEYFPVDSIKQILWNSGNVTNTKIEYSTDNGSSWITLTSSTPAAAQSYNWTVPNTPTNFAKVRISDADFPASEIADTSNNTFFISSLSLVSPNGGQNFPIGSLQTISWKTHSSISKVKLEYSTNNGSTWKTIVDSTTASALSYAWIVPNDPTVLARVRVSNASNSVVNDYSDSYFTIGSIRLTSPNGSEKWAVGNTKTITWLNVSTISSINIDYTTDNGTNWIPVASNLNASAETYNWSIPDTLTPSSLARVRVSSVTDNQIYDISDNVFTFAKISVTSPNGAEKLQVGKRINITWSASNISLVNIQVSTDNGLNWNTLANNVSASVGTYAWTISDMPTQLARIRIVDAEVPDVLDQSNATFSILKLDLTSPNLNEGWTIGTTKNITWSSSAIANVKLEYSTNNGSIWQSIIASVDATLGTYAWTIPNEPSSQSLVKISDVTTASIQDSSTSSFIIGKIAVTEPLAGSFYQAGKVLTVKWTSQGINNVRIAYTTDNGSNWNTLSNIINAATGTFNFTIPSNLNSTQARIKVSDASTGQIKDSSGLFTISSLALTSPNGGEYLQSGSTKSVTWSSSNITNINLEYSLDNGLNWLPIVSSYPAVSGSYDWALNAAFSSSTTLVRIVDASNPSIIDQSDNSFKIGSVQISSPVAGEIILAGSTKQITWTNSSSVTQIKIEYSSDDGANWNTIVNNYPSISGIYNWTVPSSLSSSTGRIRISDAGSSLNIVSTSGQFSFLALTVTSPNGGEIWQTGATKNITWSSSPTIANIKIEYSTNTGQNWFTISASVNASLGTYAWTIDTSIYSNQMSVRISDVTNSVIKDSSNSTFSVAKLRLLTPVASDYLQGGNTRQINWESSYLSNVKLAYSTNNGGSYTDIIASTPAAALSYSWTIPNNVSSSNTKIRISSASDPTISDSSQPFKVTYIRVLGPNGNENWLAGTSKAITWTAGSDIANVLIQFSTNNGNSWDSITTVTNNGSYTWTIPNSVTTTGRIRITNTANISLKDSSDNVFTVSNLSITEPILTSYWQGGTTKTIKWTSANISNIKAQYSTNNGVDWIDITASPVQASLGQLDWSIPANIFSNQAKVRIYDALDITRVVESPAFKISNLQVTTPNGGENLQAGSTKNITWSASSNIDSVLIEYSSDNGSNWNTLTTSGNSGTYSWTVPSQITTFGRIRISDKTNSLITDISNNTFTISSYVFITPDVNTYWQSGSTQQISWTIRNVNFVNIEFSSNNGANWSTVATNVLASFSGKYNWTLPGNVATNQALIRVSDVANPLNSIVSSPFKISYLNLTSPNDGEYLLAGTSRNVAWTSGSNIDSVSIEYSSDNGSTWLTLTSLANSGTYSWIVPNSVTTLGKIRIKDKSNPSISDGNNNSFVISSLVVNSPPAGSYWQSHKYIFGVYWLARNVENIKIDYSTNNGSDWIPIVASFPANITNYGWNIGNGNDIATDQAILRISDVDHPSNFAVSGVFKLSYIKVTSPNGGEILQAGATENITWNAGNNIANVKIEYSTNQGTNWVSIATVPNTGSYAWAIASNLSGLANIRVSDVTALTINDESESEFSINSLVLTSPLGGEKVQTGKLYSNFITWSASSNIAFVKVELSTDGGSTWASYSNLVNASDGKYPVTFSSSTAQAKIRITNSADATIVNQSGNFTIEQIALTAPVGTEYWQAGTSKNLTWTSALVSNVALEYSSDNGTSWNTIIASTPAAAGTYSWSIPLALASSQVKIRVSDASDNTISATHQNPFVVGDVKVVSPNGGEIILTGSVDTIKWNTSSNISLVRIDYSSDNGATWNLIKNNEAASSGQYLWTVSSQSVTPGNAFLIRVSDAASNFNIVDVSDNQFAVNGIRLVSPNGGEQYQVGAVQKIEWSASGNITKVRLEYSTDGTVWNNIQTNLTASTGFYNWTIPNVSSSTVKVKVSDDLNPSYSDISDTNFKIANVILTSPNGGESWQVGYKKNITWFAASNVSKVNLYYKPSSTGNWIPIDTNITASTNSYSWLLPNAVSQQAVVKIVDAASNFAIQDTNDAVFTISNIELTSPLGGENWRSGKANLIKWIRSSDVSNVDLYYSTNNGTVWDSIKLDVSASAGQYSWNIPANVNASQVKVRIHNSADVSISDTSDSFSVFYPSLTLVAPDGGEYIQAGSSYQIKWSSILVSKVKIDYYNGATWQQLTNTQSADSQKFTWTPDTSFSSASGKIRVLDAFDNVIGDTSNLSFKVGYVQLTTLNGGENLQANSVQNITWINSASVTSIKLELSSNNGTSWTTLQAALPSSPATYAWSVPNAPSDSLRIRISDAASSNLISYKSSAPFSISSVNLASPNGGETYQTGKKIAISWTASSNTQNVKLEYSTTSGSNWIDITDTTASLGSYNWTIPNTIANATTNALVRISNSFFPNIKDSSQAVFTIKHLEISAPVAGNEWQVNTIQTIAWNSANVQTVKIEYSTNDGTSWIPISSSVSDVLKAYNWLIPNTSTATARIKISDSANTSISVVSSQFKIYNPSLTLTSPVGSEHWQAGLTKNITWTSSLVDLIKIEYSLDEGSSWNLLKADVAAPAGTYEWKIWDTLSTNKARIKISDVRSGPAIADSSSNNFTVTKIKVVSPNGGEIFQAGTTKTIQWEISTHVSAVNLEYSSNGGTSWDPIKTNVAAALNQYSWDIPKSNQTTQGRVRIVAANALSIADTSDANFKIGWIAVTSPNGNENLQAGRTYQIAWTKSSSVSNVKIEYSLTGDANYQVIASNEVSTGKYDWTIPTDVTTNLGRIRISDATSSDQILDISDTTFKVSLLKITSPVEGTNWASGSTQTVKWNTSANISNVRIEYSSNSGLSWDTVTTSAIASDSSFDWKIPNNLISSQAKIRLFSTINSAIGDTSNKFTIFVPSVSLSYPNGSERLLAGSVDTIRWNAQYVSTIRIDYSIDNGTNWQVLKDVVDATAGKYAWQISNGLSTSQGLIRISDVTSAGIKDSSNTVFTVGWIDITSPNGNQNWLAGSQKDITWNASTSITSVKIEYYNDNSWQTIVTGVNASLGKYSWAVPSVPVTAGKIRVTDFASSTSITDTSNGNLTISILTIVSPNGGEFFHAGNINKISWTKNPIFSNLKLEYSVDNGRNWNIIVNSISASVGEYNWTIPENVTSDSAYLKITDVADAGIKDSSNSPFKIGRLQVLLPSASIKVLENTTYTIQWSGSTNIPKIDLHYTTNNGRTWVPIASAQGISSASGSYNWQVPETPSDSCSIRIRNTSDITFSTISDSLFTIAQFKLLTPNGGQVWQAGSDKDITWQYKFVTNLQIEYTTNSGTDWKSVTPNTIASSLEKYTWKIPDDINFADVNFKVRIRDIENPNIADTSNSNFTVSYLKLTSPNGGGGQQIGTSYSIRWSHSPATIKKVKLEYTIDDKNWRYIDTVSADSVSYLWKIPNTPTQLARVRVSDFSQPTISDASDSVIVISYIALKYPNGSKTQKVQAGKTYAISWEGAYLKGVSIDYSLNGGVDWNPIDDARNINPDSTSFNWTIPNTPSMQCLVRVSDFAYPAIYDVSDTFFTLCSITLTSHNELIAVQNNSVQKITWESKNIDSVRIQLSLDNGLTWPVSFPVQNAALQSYDWQVGNQKTISARLRISDQYDVTVNDVNDTNLVIGSYPKITKLSATQKDTIKFTYDFSTPGEQLDMTKFEYITQNNSPIDVLSSVSFIKNNTPGPVVDTLKWDSKNNLPNFEGLVKVKITLQSNFKVSYVVELDSVGVDNVPPKFDVTKISEIQAPFSLGWGKAMLFWSAATDSNSSIKYTVAYSTDEIYEIDSSITTSNDTVYIASLRTSTKYNVKFTVFDGLNNSQVFYTQFKTSAAADFNNDNQIDLVDLASFVKSWSTPDSTYGADLAPYTDSIPMIKVVGDQRLNIQDLFVFVDMWNYYQTTRSLPKRNFTSTNESAQIETRELKVRKGKNDFVHVINLDEESELMALSAEVHYNPSRMRFDSSSIGGINKKLEGGFTLVHNDSLNGIVTINYADLNGKLGKQLQFISTLSSNMDRLSNEDSIVIVINGINKSMEQTFTQQVVYSIKEVPNNFNLSQNYPNPFNPKTIINYELPAKARVSLMLFDILGRKVATLIDEEQNEGYYQYSLDANKVANGLASGVYIYRLSAGSYGATKKMVLLK